MAREKHDSPMIRTQGALPDKTRRTVTAYDVARLAGVSQSAVSRSFSEGTSVSKNMRQRVKDAAKKLNYRPNLVARALSTSRTRMIGVAVPPFENPFFPAMVEELSTLLQKSGYRVLLFTSRDRQSFDPILEDVLTSGVDALVMISASLSSRFADQCKQVGLPVVLLNRKTEKRIASSVTGDNTLGAESIAAFLLAGAHRRFAIIVGQISSSTSRDREEAFTGYLQRHDKRVDARATGNFSFEGAAAAAREVFSQKSRPDALFCISDHMAIAAINVARAEFGLQVGKDISIIGFDDISLASWPAFDLTTYAQPIAEMAGGVIEIILAQLSSADQTKTVDMVVPGQLVVRSSARVPRHGVVDTPSGRTWRMSSG
jgi:DNA-binding LacI/PurR family transcriptional regulator